MDQKWQLSLYHFKDSSYQWLLSHVLAVTSYHICYQKGGERLGYESEAFAIYDTMEYVKSPIYTVCVGTAYGEPAMLLAAGKKVGG